MGVAKEIGGGNGTGPAADFFYVLKKGAVSF